MYVIRKLIATMTAFSMLLLMSFSHAQTQPVRTAEMSQENGASVTSIEPKVFVNAALRIASAVDASMAGRVWDSASVVAKRSIKRTDFVANAGANRKAKGRVMSRSWIGVRRQSSPGGQLPSGTYATVELEVMYENGGVGREIVSFRHDDDGVWRFVGYVSN